MDYRGQTSNSAARIAKLESMEHGVSSEMGLGKTHCIDRNSSRNASR